MRFADRFWVPKTCANNRVIVHSQWPRVEDATSIVRRPYRDCYFADARRWRRVPSPDVVEGRGGKRMHGRTQKVTLTWLVNNEGVAQTDSVGQT